MGPEGPGAARRLPAQHISTPRSHDTKLSRRPGWDFAYQAETSGTRQLKVVHGRPLAHFTTSRLRKWEKPKPLHRPTWGVGSLAPRLPTPRPVRKPFLRLPGKNRAVGAVPAPAKEQAM